MKCGIYKIINLKINKFYLGSSVNIEKRLTQHICDLRANRHHSVYLQRCYNKPGEYCFKLEIVELCEETSLKEKEQKYLCNVDYTNS
jgi:group I intron endonuclease